MRRPVLFTILLTLFVACGGGAEKDAFQRYERSVAGLLEQEAELRARYDEELDNATAYGDDAGFREIVAERVVPFYAEMKKKVMELVPESEALRAIHANLIEYAAVRSAFFETGKQTEAIAAAEGALLEKLSLATRARETRTIAFNKAVEAAPAMLAKITPFFGDEGAAINALFTNLEAMRGGRVRSAEFVRFIDEKLLPFYAQIDQGLAGLGDSNSGAEVVRTGKAYVASTREIIAVARDLALALGPIQERFLGLADRATDLLDTYRSSAKAYRDSLR